MVLGSTVGTLKRGVDWCKDKISTRETEDSHLSVSPERRRFLQQAGATAAVAGAGASAATGSASAYTPVGPDLIKCDVSRTDDSMLPWSSGGNYGGWRATEKFGVSGGSVDNTPVVFVHGNNGDACNFEEHANYLLNNGWSGDEIYSITFEHPTTSHVDMRDQLDDFVQEVMNETGASQISVVAHSLGVTGARYWQHDLGRDSWVSNFVGLNGGNHGVCVCPGCYDTSLDDDYNGWLEAGSACQFIAVQCFADTSHPLYDLNVDETPGNADYYTVRGFWDPLYYCNPYSPYLDGADNNLIYRNHTSSLVDDGVKADVDSWCSTSGNSNPSPSSKDVSWWVEANLDGYGDTYGVVEIQQHASDYDLRVSLIDPNGDEADYDYVYDYDMDADDVRVELDMNGYDAVAEAGEWELLVEYDDYSKDGIFHQETVDFDDYNPTMVADDYEYYQDEWGDYYLTDWEITIENKGDIPLHVTDVEVEIDGDTDYQYPERTLNAGDRDTYECTDSDTWLSDGTGTYDVNFEMDVDDQLWATGTFDLEVK